MEHKYEYIDIEDCNHFIESIKENYSNSQLTDNDKAMLDYAVKLTENPSAITKTDIDRLQNYGFDDRAIHDICCITAYFNFVNRVADGLGVTLEKQNLTR